jgi:hypothetical protein
MKTNKLFYILFFAISFHTSCQKDKVEPEIKISSEEAIQTIIDLDLAIHFNQEQTLVSGISIIEQFVEQRNELLFEDELIGVQELSKSIAEFKKSLNKPIHRPYYIYLENMRLNLYPYLFQNNNNHYIFELWELQSSLLDVVNIAQDQMMDLYEWGEFIDKVSCMNENWSKIYKLSPSFQFLQDDPFTLKYHALMKNQLRQRILAFNQAINSENGDLDILIAEAKNLENAYYNYLKSFDIGLRFEDRFYAYLAS